MARFEDRADAGRHLARELSEYTGREDVVVLALPPGGVVVGFEVAKALDVPLDVFVVRKLGVPLKKEVAMGAIAPGGVRILDEDVLTTYRIIDSMVEEATAVEQYLLQQREKTYRAGLPPLDVKGKTVILVDDGLASEIVMQAAVTALRRLKPVRIVAAVPTGAAAACDLLEREVDTVVCAMTPVPFLKISNWYTSFSPPTDEEVLSLLEEARRMRHAA